MPTYNDYFASYINLTEGETTLEAIENSFFRNMALLSSITEDQGDSRYAENKWTVKEVIAHMNDTERIMAYRALRFARNDRTELQGYDETHYAMYSNANNRTVGSLVAEFEEIRKSTLSLFESFNDDMLAHVGTANGMSIDVKALGLVIAGHSLHHCEILKDRYDLT